MPNHNSITLIEDDTTVEEGTELRASTYALTSNAAPGGASSYAADSYNSDMDIVEGMAYGCVCLAPYLVTLFFVVQFFTAFQYAGLAHCCGLSDAVYERLYSLCCLSLLWPLLSDLSQNGGK